MEDVINILDNKKIIKTMFYENMSIRELSYQLDLATGREDYELCAIIKKEIERREIINEQILRKKGNLQRDNVRF